MNRRYTNKLFKQIFCTLKCVYIFGGPSVVLYVGVNIDNNIYDLPPPPQL
jgi:hypothetical protein